MTWKQKSLALIGWAVALVGAFVVGLFVYVNATMKPLHPNAKDVQSVTASSPSRQWANAVEQGRQLVRASVVGQNLPGVSVAVGVDGDIVWAEGFGWADLEKRLPVAPGTRFRIGGASMAFTSAAVGLLLEKDRLNLDTDIQKYVPDFPEKQWPVTLRELMGHMAGITGDGGDEEPLSERCERTVDGTHRFAERPLRFEPGTRYRYSTYGWILVSEGDYSCFAGAGAFLSTPSDLARFGMAIISGKLLQPATVKMLQAPQRLASGEETGYGLGWDRETVSIAGETTTSVGHDGEFFIGGSTSFITFPERGLVVAVTTNISFADTAAMALKIAQAFAEQGKSPARK